MNDLILIGQVVGTHGIKGELKIISNFEKKDAVFQIGFKIYIDNQKYTITSYRPHKNFDMIIIDSMHDINEVLKFIGLKVYIKRSDLNLKNNEYLLNDLIGFAVFDEKTNIGKVIAIYENNKYDYILVNGQKEFYIPLVAEYILNIDLVNKKIYTKGGKELIL